LRALLVAEVISTTGTQMTWLALPWFVLTTTGSAAQMAYVLAAEAAAVGLFGLWGGALAGRLGPRRAMIVCDAVRAPLMVAIPVLHLAGVLSFPLLLALVFAYGAFVAPSIGAQRALLPELVGEDGPLGEATALLQGATRATLVLGPPLAGVLIGVIGATNLLFVDAGTYAVSVALVALFVPAGAPLAVEQEDRSVLAGLRFVVRDRLLRPWTAAIVGIDVCWNVLFAALPVLVLTKYGGRPELLGWLFGSFGAGALVGSAIAFHIVGSVDRLLLASLAILGQTAPLWLLPLAVPAPVLVAALALAGVFNPIVNAPMGAAMLARTPRAVRASASTVPMSVTAVLSPAALVASGPALAVLGARPVLAAAVVAQSAAMVLLCWAGLRERALLAHAAV
jgi:MFS family permease